MIWVNWPFNLCLHWSQRQQQFKKESLILWSQEHLSTQEAIKVPGGHKTILCPESLPQTTHTPCPFPSFPIHQSHKQSRFGHIIAVFKVTVTISCYHKAHYILHSRCANTSMLDTQALCLHTVCIAQGKWRSGTGVFTAEMVIEKECVVLLYTKEYLKKTM